MQTKELQGNKRNERFNPNKPQKFMFADRILLKTNPVSTHINNATKKYFRLYDGSYSLLRQVGKQTFIVYDDK